MNNETLIKNVEKYAAEKKVSVSQACVAAGCSKNFISDVKRGASPTLWKVAHLAWYFGVSVSDLVGDIESLYATRHPINSVDFPPRPYTEIQGAFDQLNEEGQKRLLEYAVFLSSQDEYKKYAQTGLGKEA